jgi:hypothetical protein
VFVRRRAVGRVHSLFAYCLLLLVRMACACVCRVSAPAHRTSAQDHMAASLDATRMDPKHLQHAPSLSPSFSLSLTRAVLSTSPSAADVSVLGCVVLQVIFLFTNLPGWVRIMRAPSACIQRLTPAAKIVFRRSLHILAFLLRRRPRLAAAAAIERPMDDAHIRTTRPEGTRRSPRSPLLSYRRKLKRNHRPYVQGSILYGLVRKLIGSGMPAEYDFDVRHLFPLLSHSLARSHPLSSVSLVLGLFSFRILFLFCSSIE